MRTIEIEIYQFSELSESAQEKAIESLYDLNVDYDWWNFNFYDAEQVGITIKGFGVYVDKIHGEIDDCLETANSILKNHGEDCDTYKTAKEFLSDRDKLVREYSGNESWDKVAEENIIEFDDHCDSLEDDFKKAILEDFLALLKSEYEYRISKEVIVETIEANEYEFTVDGKMY